MNYIVLFTAMVAVSLLASTLASADAVQMDHADHFMRYQLVMSPYSQFLNDVPIGMISCGEGLELIMKKTNGMPACVRPSTVAILLERGWGIHVMADYDVQNNNSGLFKTGKGPFTVRTEDVQYFENYTGYLALPEDEGVFPGVVIIHEWWGLNDNMKQTAEEIASHGYVVLAVDLFGKEPATTAEEARLRISSFDPERGVANMNGAVDYIRTNYHSDKIGSVGWCFGGGQSLALALNNSDMDATVIYYGSITSDKEQLSSITWPVLGIFAGLDTGIPVESVEEFKRSLEELQIENEIYIYQNVNHGFANPSGQRHAPGETQDAWKKTIAFLHDTLQ